VLEFAGPYPKRDRSCRKRPRTDWRVSNSRRLELTDTLVVVCVVIGTEATEYKRVVDASLHLFGGVAIVAVLLHLDLARGYFLTAMPQGLGSQVFSTYDSQWMKS
jgi:hypothetical protein